MEHLQNLVGKKVVKFPSRKPFKSGFKINTVKGIITHEHTGLPAFIFQEDDSYVEVRKCIPENFKIDFKEVYRLYPGCRIIKVVEFYIPGTGWEKEWQNHVKLQKSLLKAEDQIKRCWIDGAIKVMLRIEHEGEIKESDYSMNELVTF